MTDTRVIAQLSSIATELKNLRRLLESWKDSETEEKVPCFTVEPVPRHEMLVGATYRGYSSGQVSDPSLLITAKWSDQGCFDMNGTLLLHVSEDDGQCELFAPVLMCELPEGWCWVRK